MDSISTEIRIKGPTPGGTLLNYRDLLSCFPTAPTSLPNLLSLDWDSDDADLPFIVSFISRSLTSINIEVSASASLILPSILTRLPTLAPDISEIVVRQPKYEPSLEEASSLLLMQCNPNRLRTYNVDAPLSASAFSQVIQLPLLENLWLVEPFHFPDPLPDVVFPNLQRLNVEFTRDLALLKILPKCPDLSEIEITCPGPDVTQAMEIFHSTITGCGLHERLQELSFCSHDEFKVTPQMITFNSSLKNLTDFELSSYSTDSTSCQTLNLTDADISLLTNAMPNLQNLVIGEEPCRVPSKITFNSLYTISSRCTGLRTLRIHFNPDSFITKVNADFKSGNGDFDIPSSELCLVTKINVGRIGLPTNSNASYIVALGLLKVFLCLEEVVYCGHDFDWVEVNRLIGFYRDIRTAFVRK